jgi:hypothetical protein
MIAAAFLHQLFEFQRLIGSNREGSRNQDWCPLQSMDSFRQENPNGSDPASLL